MLDLESIVDIHEYNLSLVEIANEVFWVLNYMKIDWKMLYNWHDMAVLAQLLLVSSASLGVIYCFQHLWYEPDYNGKVVYNVSTPKYMGETNETLSCRACDAKWLNYGF